MKGLNILNNFVEKNKKHKNKIKICNFRQKYSKTCDEKFLQPLKNHSIIKRQAYN